MSISEQMDGWGLTVSDVMGSGSKDAGNPIDSELASIVSSLSALSNPTLQRQQSQQQLSQQQQSQQQQQQQQAQQQSQQQIGGFRRASFNSNAGSDVDSEILFASQNSPMLRRTTLSVGGVSLPANTSSHAQNRLNPMNHYSASIAGGLTAQFQAYSSNNNNNNGSTVGSNSAANVASSGGTGFFERFGRALAEGTREVELNMAPVSQTVSGQQVSVGSGAAGAGSRRTSASPGMEHLSRVGSTTTMQAAAAARRMSDTSDVLESVSESLSMQHNEPNPTTIWNVAAAPVFRPQDAQQAGVPQSHQMHQPNRQFYGGAGGNGKDDQDPGITNNIEQPQYNYGYPPFNQFGVPMFIPPVLSPHPHFPGMPSDQNLEDATAAADGNAGLHGDEVNNGGSSSFTGGDHVDGSAARDAAEQQGLKNGGAGTKNGATDMAAGASPMMPHPPNGHYPFPTPYPFMFPPVKENAIDDSDGNSAAKPPMSPPFIPQLPYMFIPPGVPVHNHPNAQDSTSTAETTRSGKRGTDSKFSTKSKGNPYLHNGKPNYGQFSPPPSRMNGTPQQNSQHGGSSTPNSSKPARQGKGARQSNKPPIIRSPLLEEFRNNPTNKVYKLSDIYGSALEFCKDQHGSRFIQQELATASDAEKEVIFNEIRDESIPLSHDVFGNYVIQKFFEHGTKTQKEVLVDQFRGKMEVLSLEMYACRVIQKALEFLDEDQKVSLVSELSNRVLVMIKDQNGNHVIQKAIECIPIEKLPFILQSLKGQIYHLSTHSYGCRVVQRLLEFGSLEDQDNILNDLDEFIPFLIQDQYGNYVIQHILQHGTDDTSVHIGRSKQNIIDTICKNVVEFSKHKFASNVVEKSVVYGSKSQIRQILDEILPKDEEHAADLEDSAPLILMMRDQYANYVVQKLVGVATDNDERLIVIAIRSYLDRSNKNNTLGNRHLASVEKLATLVENIKI